MLILANENMVYNKQAANVTSHVRSMRDTTQLPGTDELKGIIEFEAKRDVPQDKLNAHYPNFDVFIQLLDRLHLKADFIKKDVSNEIWLREGYQERSDELIWEMVEKIGGGFETSDRLYFDAAYDYLSEEESLEKADALFVFGAKTPLRAQKAAELYRDRWSQKIIFSGHGPFTGRDETAEAETYRDLAINAGVHVEDILTETKSITVPDNVRSSLNMFDEIDFKFQSLIIVNSPYVQRRGWCHFKKYLPDTIKLIRQNCDTGEKFSRDGWFTNPEGIKVVLNEFIKMKIAMTLNTA